MGHHFMKQHGGLPPLVSGAGSDGAENRGYNIFWTNPTRKQLTQPDFSNGYYFKTSERADKLAKNYWARAEDQREVRKL